MTKRLLILAVLSLTLWNCNQPKRDDSKTSGPIFQENIRPTEPRTPAEEEAGFIVPEGFEIKLFASEPNIDKPMNLTWDAQGRMWVTQSFEYPFPTSPGVRGTDKLTIVEDTNGDGVADKFTVVADTLNIPIGILPTSDGAFTFSVPNLYKFNVSAEGQLQNSSFAFGPFGYADTHGMVSNLIRGYDGWVHACHGFTNYSKIAGTDGDTITMTSGNTFRFRMDGSRVEQTTFGQVNPFGLVYDVYGYIYSTDSHSSPLYQLIRGGDYPHFGKVPIMGFGPDMKSLEKEATALCGITQYASDLYPSEFLGNFFIGDVVNSRVHRYSYVWKGSSPVGKSEDDFVKSEDPWFRPVNVKVGPDGAIYVADFYNAIIGHYEVPLDHPKRDKQRGRIWRITYKGKKNDVKDMTKMSVDELIATLDDKNLSVRMRATDQLTDRIGASASEVLRKTLVEPSTSSLKFIHSLWALHRLGSLSDDNLKAALAKEDSLVRVHALRVLVEKPADGQYYELITNALNDKSPHVQRVATELLMKYPSSESVESALAVLRRTDPGFDTHLFYTGRLALRNILRDEVVLNDIVSKTWNEQDASFIAGVMVDVALPASAKFLTQYMSQYSLPAERVPAAYVQIARFTPKDQLAGVVDRALGNDKTDLMQRSSIFKALNDGLNQRSDNPDRKVFQKYGPTLAAEIFKKFPGSDTTDYEPKAIHQRIAIDIAADYKVKELQPELKLFLATGHKIGWTVRLNALRALMKIDLAANAPLGGNIIQNDSVIEFQRRAAAVMAEFPGAVVNKVLDGVKSIPQDLQENIVIALAGSADGKNIVFNKVRRGEILPRTLMSARAEERLMMNATKDQIKAFEELTAEVEPISVERQKLINARLVAFEQLDRKSLSLDSGHMVFDQNCGVCHKVGGQMGVGPQLDGIGKTGARGLMEKILDPNRNISGAFKNYTIQMKDGTVKSGLYRRDEGASKVFADITGKEFVVAKKDIAEQKLSKYTLMPDSFGTTIPEKEFNLLINYLLTL